MDVVALSVKVKYLAYLNPLKNNRVESKMNLNKVWIWEQGVSKNGNPLQYSCLENPRDRGA